MSIGQYASQPASTFARVIASSFVDTDRSGHSVNFPARITEVSWQRIPSPAVSGWLFRLLAAAACSAQAQPSLRPPQHPFHLGYTPPQPVTDLTKAPGLRAKLTGGAEGQARSYAVIPA